MRILLEELRELSKEECDEYTKWWFAIRNEEKIDIGRNIPNVDGGTKDYTHITAIEKRKAFDDLYDLVTLRFFNSDNVDLRILMRKLWLNIGFESADGSNEAMMLAQDLIEFPEAANRSAAMVNLLVAEADNTILNAIEDSQFIQNLMGKSDEFWTYSTRDIKNIIKAISKIPTDKEKEAAVFVGGENTNDYKGKLNNLRKLAKDETTEDKKYIKVQKFSIDTKTEENVAKVLKSLGITNSTGDKELLSRSLELIK